MAFKIEINCESYEDLSHACEEVACKIEDGYYSGIVDCSGGTWSVEEI